MVYANIVLDSISREKRRLEAVNPKPSSVAAKMRLPSGVVVDLQPAWAVDLAAYLSKKQKDIGIEDWPFCGIFPPQKHVADLSGKLFRSIIYYVYIYIHIDIYVPPCTGLKVNASTGLSRLKTRPSNHETSRDGQVVLVPQSP